MSATNTSAIFVPGPRGGRGTDGSDGSNGTSSYTTVSTAFTMPSEGADVTVTVGSSVWMPANGMVYVENAGYLRIQSRPTTTSVVLRNMESTGTSSYPDNVAPGTSIPVASLISPGGLQGPTGSVSGSAGGDLVGTFPNPTLGVTSSKGQLIANQNGSTAPRNVALSPGSNGTVLHSDSGQTGLQHRGIDLSGTNTSLLNSLGGTKGGHGQTSLSAGVNALLNSISSVADGDILYRTGGNWARLAIGTSGQVLQSNGTAPVYGSVASSFVGFQTLNASTTLTLPTTPVTVYSCDTSGGLIYITLPAASSAVSGSTTQIMVFMKVSTSQVLRLIAGSGDTIDNTTHVELPGAALGVVTIVSDGGTQWQSIAT